MFRQMRRIKQQLSEQETKEILTRGSTGILAVNGDGGYPYTVPLNYVYKDGRIYFHCAREGHKFDALTRDGRVSFCVIDRDQVVPDEFATYYKSAVAFGHARLLEGEAVAQAAYDLGFKYNPDPAKVRAEVNKDAAHVACFEIEIDHLTGKQAKGLLTERH